jgi:hypothetical protein
VTEAATKPPFNIGLRCSCGATMSIEVHPTSYFDFSALVGLCNGWIEAHKHRAHHAEPPKGAKL